MKRKPGPAPDTYLWNGRIYVGTKAVAEAAGVGTGTVSYHLNTHGNLDRLGHGNARHFRAPVSSKPVNIGPRAFPSRRDLARAIGVNDSTVSRWLKDGQADRILSALMHADTLRSGEQQ